MEIKTRNINTAFRKLVGGLHNKGILTEARPSRYGDVLQVPEPLLLTYTHPKEHVLFNPERDANAAFHMYEALWMLAGRNDVAPLAYYNKRMAEFSDDGKTFNAAYGRRWRFVRCEDCGGHAVDQLKLIVAHLKAKPDSRRAVLQIWSVEDDLLKVDTTRDNACLAPEVEFRSPEGDTPIRALAGKFQTERGFKFPVYSVDPVTGDQRICWMTNAWKSGVKSVFRLTFDDKSSIRLTGDHIVYKKKKLFLGRRCIGLSISECRVCDLVPGDRLLSELPKNSVSRLSTSGYRTFKRNLFKNTSLSNMILEHREYLSLSSGLRPYKDGYSVHHIDGDRTNNSIINLVEMENSDHFRLGKLGNNNPHCKMSKEAKIQRGRKHSKALKDHWEGMDEATRKAYACRKCDRTNKQWELIELYRSSKSNHKIVSIERAGVTNVYDFTVPGRHNAVLGNGLVVHNCNTQVYFALRKDRVIIPTYPDELPPRWMAGKTYLDMTVCNRSNDLIWGMLGANAVHFSMLLEYMAAQLGVEVGLYHQFTNNCHAYTSNWQPDKWLVDYEQGGTWSHEWYQSEGIKLVPLVQNPAVFDLELPAFVEAHAGQEGQDIVERGWMEPFLNFTAQPLLNAFHCHKQKHTSEAKRWADLIQAEDWRTAMKGWLHRRHTKAKEKV